MSTPPEIAQQLYQSRLKAFCTLEGYYTLIVDPEPSKRPDVWPRAYVTSGPPGPEETDVRICHGGVLATKPTAMTIPAITREIALGRCAARLRGYAPNNPHAPLNYLDEEDLLREQQKLNNKWLEIALRYPLHEAR